MNVELFVPICVLRVRYELASGRPFSDLERLVLSYLAETGATVTSLAEAFCLRPAIMIESLVTLAREGWVALDGKTGKYVITSTGRSVALTEDSQPQFLEIEERHITLLMERISGGLIGNDVRYLKKSDFPDYKVPLDLTLDAEWWHTRLSGGQVDPFLTKSSRHRSGEQENKWVHRVDTPQLVGVDDFWVRASVNMTDGRVSFDGSVPIPWESTLRDALHRKAEAVAQAKIRLVKNYDFPSFETDIASWTSVQLAESDLWIDKEHHSTALIDALNGASSFVHVASAFFDPSALNAYVRPALLAALQRGVMVGLLWGYEQGEKAKEVVRWLDKVAIEAGEQRYKLWFNKVASDSHAKILAWDAGEALNVVVGSCNWLSTPSLVNEMTRLNFSFCIRNPLAAAEFLLALAGLWLQTGRQDWYPAADHLFGYAAKIAAERVAAQHLVDIRVNRKIKMVCDFDHERVMRELLLRASHRCWVSSHKLGDNAALRLASLSHQGRPVDIETLVSYEQLSHQEIPIDVVADQVRAAGGQLKQLDNFHAKCIIADDVAFISSFNFLSAGPFGSGRAAREVGILVNNKDIADRLWALATGV